MDTYIVFWLAATVVFVLVELMTVGLTSIWFAAGSFVAFIIALLGGNVVVQGIAFILVSVVLLALTKPWAGKYINSRTVKTNVDSLVGERAVLTEDADSMKQTGKAVVNGQEWTVRPQDETQVIRKSQAIQVGKKSRVKIILKKVGGDPARDGLIERACSVASVRILVLVNCIKIVPQAHAMVIERLGGYLTTWS